MNKKNKSNKIKYPPKDEPILKDASEEKNEKKEVSSDTIKESEPLNMKKDNIQENHIDKKYRSLLVPSRKNNSFFVTSFFSDKGNKTHHNNHFTYEEFDDFGIWIVVDGNNGGGFENEIAPILGEMILEEFIKHPTMDPKYIKDMLLQINKRIILLQKDKYTEMKQYSFCSFVIMITDYSRILFVNVGTSRGILIRDEKVIHKTCDDSLAHLMYERGSIFYNEIRFRKDKNEITQKFGLDSKININFSETTILLPNDKAMLLSLGAWENLDEEDIISELNNNVRCGQWVSGVIKKIRTNNSYFLDNFTLCGISFNRPIPYFKDPGLFERFSKDFKEKANAHYKKVLLLLILILLAFGGKKYYDNYKLNKEIDDYIEQIRDNIAFGDGKMETLSFGDSVPLYNNALEIYEKLKLVSKESMPELIDKVDYKIEQSKIGSQILDSIKDADRIFEADQYGLAKNRYENIQELLESFTIDNPLKPRTSQELKKKIEISGILEEAYSKKLEADDMYERPREKRRAIGIYEEIAPVFNEHKRVKIYEEIMNKLNANEEPQRPQTVRVQVEEDTTNYINLGDAAFGRGEYSRSLSLYNQALQNRSYNDPNTARGKINMNNIILSGSIQESTGDSMVQRRDYSGAIERYEAAIIEYRKLRGDTYLPGGIDRTIDRVNIKLNRIRNER